MKRDREDSSEESDDEQPLPKHLKTTFVLEDLHRNLKEPDNINQQLMDTQQQYFTVYMEKLMNQIPMGKAVIDVVRKNNKSDDFIYMYTASKTIIQSLLTVKQTKATKAVVDMVAGVMCRCVHENFICPMLNPVLHDEHLKAAFHAYQNCVRKEEDDAELEMRCLLHTIHQLLEKEQDAITLPNPFKAQMTQQMKAISEYVVALLLSISKPCHAKTTESG